MSASSETPITIERDPILADLALQGGGSHGAFAWGVLDRRLKSLGSDTTEFPARRLAP